MEDKLLKLVYTFFLGLIIAVFVGMGVSTFYTAPVMPVYPTGDRVEQIDTDETVVTQAYRDYEVRYEHYDDEMQTYHRNVSIITLITAVLLLAISFLLERKNHVITNGVMLGGLFVLVYSIGRGFASTDSRYTFIAVSVSLLIVLYLGYRRFGNAQNSNSTLKVARKVSKKSKK